jgi:hypothetical protein
MLPRFTIFATNASTGEEFECFTWTRDADAGIRRAYADAERFGMTVTNVRAEAL